MFKRDFSKAKMYQENLRKAQERTQRQLIRSTMQNNAKLGFRRRI